MLSAAFEILNLQARYCINTNIFFYTLKMRDNFCWLANYLADYLYYAYTFRSVALQIMKGNEKKKGQQGKNNIN